MNTKFGTLRNMSLNIKRRLIEKNVEQSELAAVWGITNAATSNLLSGKRKIEADKLFAAADFLGCSVYDLIKPAIGSFEEEHGGENFE